MTFQIVLRPESNVGFPVQPDYLRCFTGEAKTLLSDICFIFQDIWIYGCPRGVARKSVPPPIPGVVGIPLPRQPEFRARGPSRPPRLAELRGGRIACSPVDGYPARRMCDGLPG